ncbi:UbiH/UbiF family hydroxylase [Pseudaestuariivita rosea]|uniref:UbiH/UbiF family hydroxylase n=1 Tax=Pseudaestuariivita rosea TaxID=2763263 RepID=UPI001ABB48C6|nr:UbiH/UbiF family hydroxylase [Pseudaestuariivita rosea]
MKQVDIVISGGGVAGLTAAAAFGAEGFDVLCVDPAPPVTERNVEGADLRTTAFLQPARDFLEQANLWPRLQDYATDLAVMRIVDAGGPRIAARMTKDFRSSDISDQPFGWNLPNWLLRREMTARLAELPNVDFRPGVAVADVVTRETQAIVMLSDGDQIRARLVIGADGRNSAVRQAIGVGVKTRRYGQKALAFAVTHSVRHENVSTEIHRSGGPFTLVPLPDYEGRPSSAVVWMEEGAEAKRLFDLAVPEFEEAMTERSCYVNGPLKLASQKTIWPIISQIADRFYGERTALVAEAAHVVPPIGAQGLNMSLADISVLLDLAKQKPDALGSTEMLQKYHRSRYPEIQLRVTGVDMLNRASMLKAQPLKDLRAFGLNALHSVTPVRKSLMKLGLGVRG